MSFPVAAHWFDHLALVSAGLFVAAIAAIPARKLLRADPSACYRLCLALLLGALALLPLQWIVQGSGRELLAPARARVLRWLEEPPQRLRPPGDGSILVDAPSREPAAADDATPLVVTVAELQPALAPEEFDPPAQRAAFAPDLRRSLAPLVSIGRTAGAALRGRLGLALWLLGVVLVAGHRLLAVGRTLRLLRAAKPVSDPELLALWKRVAAGSPVAGRVRLLASDAVASPACVGWLRPLLVLPGGARPRLPNEVLAWGLRHELVHLERGDSLVAALQSLVTALLWFHPAAWWLSAEIGRLRELSCDQKVVRDSGRRRSYALALLEYAAARNGTDSAIDAGPHSAGVSCALLHWSRSPSQIQRRIEMLTVDSSPATTARRTIGRLLALGAFLLPALGQVGVAATLLPKDNPAAQAAPAAPAPPAREAACAVASDGDGACCQEKAKQGKKHAAIAAAPRAAINASLAQAEEQRAATLAGLHARLADERAAGDDERRTQRARVHDLRAKLEAAEEAEDEEACHAIKQALERCETECEAAGEAYEARCEGLGEAIDELEQLDLAVELGDLDFDVDDLQAELGDLEVELGDLELGIDDGQFDFDAQQVADQVAQAMQAAQSVQDTQADGEKVRRKVEKEMEAASRALAEASKQYAQAKRFHNDADQEKLAIEMDKHKEALVKAARAQAEAARQVVHSKHVQEAIDEARAAGRSHGGQEGAPDTDAKPRRIKLRAGQAAPAPEPETWPEPRTSPTRPAHPRPPAPPEPPDAPRPPVSAPRMRGAPAGAPPHASSSHREDALMQRIEALEAEIAELRAMLEAERGERTPAPQGAPRSRALRR